MNADDSAELRNLLANNRTLLAYIRTALAFAGLGFAVAKFGLNPRTMHVSGYLGTFMVLVGLLIIIIGFAQHRAVMLKVETQSGVPGPSRSLPCRGGRRLRPGVRAPGHIPRYQRNLVSRTGAGRREPVPARASNSIAAFLQSLAQAQTLDRR